MARSALGALREIAGRYRAIVLGPGLSREDETARLVKDLVRELDKSLVLDADGLFPYAGRIEELADAAGELVITPHAGELGRLMGVDGARVDEDRLGCARRAAEAIGGTVVLKGARTIIATKDGSVINRTGNPGLATAGTGDVLSGVIAAFMAQGLRAAQAAELGVYLHGLAGDIAADTFSSYAFLAGDVADGISHAFKALMDSRSPAGKEAGSGN
ncbi:MAG: NAD(P)H-hydrate dehydratase [Chloroflexi bacterium]|nr:NAD(P)H-hydrate dehydratase [Chloroflexota bacterium]